NQFVAGFVGSPQMNLLTLQCQGQTARLGQGKLPLPSGLSKPPRQVVLGVRPEDMRLAQESDSIRFLGEVFLVENLGMQNLLSVRLAPGEGEQGPVEVRSLLPSDLDWGGDTIELAVSPERLHWFDVESGDRLS
ncbi:TOBE domain-containing protein, partial [Geitlerinema sp. P-1104]|uniref:TOBE domain-containing protein n=1 Tax=Geitlerinema sp. P-1104 TaxID=2546230 RepID=UPI001476E592